MRKFRRKSGVRCHRIGVRTHGSRCDTATGQVHGRNVLTAPHRACLHRPLNADILPASWDGAQTDCRLISEFGKALTDPWDMAPFLLRTDGFTRIRQLNLCTLQTATRSTTGTRRAVKEQNEYTHTHTYIKSSQTALLLVHYFPVCCMPQKLSHGSLRHGHISPKRRQPV